MNPIATVMSVQGSVWAQSPDGSVRLLRAGDQLMADEVLVSAAGSQIMLDFGNGNVVTLTGEQVVQMADTIRANVSVDPDESQLTPETVELLERLLGPLSESSSFTTVGSISSQLGEQGFGFVELARIGSQLEADGINPLRLNRVSNQLERAGVNAIELDSDTRLGLPGNIYAQQFNHAGSPEVAQPGAAALPGAITVALPDVSPLNQGNTLITGTVSNLPAGSVITVVLSDSLGNTAAGTTISREDGSYQIELDTSALVDGPLQVVATAVDMRNEVVSGNDSATKDTVPGAIQVGFGALDNEAGLVDISGSTTRVAAGATVTLVISDQAGASVSVSAQVQADGSYSVSGVDISALAYGSLSVTAQAVDIRGQGVSDTDNIAFTAPEGAITVSIDGLSDAGLLDLSGSTEYVAPGSSVTLVISDGAGGRVEVSVNTDANGNYSLAGIDISSLRDGPITVTASTIDRRDEEVTDTASTSLDLLPGSIDVDLPDVNASNAMAVSISGSTSDVPPGGVVTIVITDSQGGSVTASATVREDGSYQTTANLSGLQNGSLSATATATDNNGEPVSDTDGAIKNVVAAPVIPPGTIDVQFVAVDDVNKEVNISGSTSNVTTGQNVTLTITDQFNGQAVFTTTVLAGGTFLLTGASIAGLKDGPITVVATAVAQNGATVSDSDNEVLDALPGAISVQLSNVNDGNETDVPIRGTTTDVKPGAIVTLVITDQLNISVSATATVQADGSYLTTVDLSGLADGRLDVSATATDNNGTSRSAADDAIKDALAGSIRVDVDAVDNGASTIDLSGTTSNVNVGTTVTLTITSANGGTPVTVTTLVQVGGTYSIADVNVAGLTDGPLTVTAQTVDMNGNTIDDDTTATLNAVTGSLTLVVTDPDLTDTVIDVSGTTTDVPAGSVVTIVITDQSGTSITVTTPTDGNGNYELTNIDISTLKDGPLTIKASTTDHNGNVVDAAGASTLDNVAGAITVQLPDVNSGNETAVTISGTTTDVAPGATVTLVINDTDGSTAAVTVTAVVQANGTYATTADLSSLTNGTLTAGGCFRGKKWGA